MDPAEGLFFDSIVKSFGGTHALSGVSLKVRRGEIVALLGENGAGKSTLIKVLGGIHTPDSGQVTVDGIPYKHVAGHVNERQAVAFIHQDLGLIEWMSVAENIALAVGYARKGGRIDWPACEEVAKRALALVDADFAPTTRVSNLSRTEKSLVAIARALIVECDFLVLDEPTASLPALVTWNPSTSLSGLIAAMTACSSRWPGKGSWTSIPSTAASLFSRSTSASRSASDVSAGRRCSKLSMLAATVALCLLRT